MKNVEMKTTTLPTIENVVKVVTLKYPEKENNDDLIVVTIYDDYKNIREASIVITDQAGEVFCMYGEIAVFLEQQDDELVKEIENYNGFNFEKLDWE